MARRLWGLVLVLTLAVGAGYFLYKLRTSNTVPEGNVIPLSTRRELNERVIRTLEVDESAGNEVLPVNRRVCAARVFGAEPLRVQQVSDVEKVYAHVFCVEVKPDNAVGSGRMVPIAMNLGAKVRVDVPRNGSQFGADVKRIFPSRLRHIASDRDSDERDLQADINRRVRDLPPPG